MSAEKRMSHPFQVGYYHSDGEIIGKGQFATVYLAKHIDTGVTYAIKEMDFGKIAKNSKSQQHLIQEIKVMQEIHHPNVVTLYHTQKIGPYVDIVMDYCNAGDFRAYLDVHKSLTEENALYFMRQFANGLYHLRVRNIVHRDLKPQNLLLSEDEKGVCTLKIADFGFAKFVDANNPLETYCGTPLYMAPEVLQHGKYSDKADLWSVGVIMYEMLAGRRPWEAKSIPELMYKIQQPWTIPYTLKSTLSPECIDLLLNLLEYTESKRISWDNFFQHPWLLGQKLPVAAPPTATTPTTVRKESSVQNDNSDMAATRDQLNLYMHLEYVADEKRTEGRIMDAVALYQRVLTGLRKVKSACPDPCKERDLAEEHFVSVYEKMEELFKVVENAPPEVKMVPFDPDEVLFSYAIQLGQSGNSIDTDKPETAVSMFSSGVSVLRELVKECEDPESKRKYQLYLEKFIERLEIANTKLKSSH